MRTLTYLFLTAFFLFPLLNNTLSAQPLLQNDSVKRYDQSFKNELQKPWKKTTLQKTSDVRSKWKDDSTPQDKGKLEGILPKNDVIAAYDQEFAAQLRKGKWRAVDFLQSNPYRLTDKPKYPPFILENTSIDSMLVSRNAANLKRPVLDKLLIHKDYKNHFNASIDNVQFYGWQFPIFYDDRISKFQLDSPDGIGNFWGTLGSSEWEVFLKQVEEYAGKMNVKVGDWAYALLLHKIGSYIFFDRKANTVFTCFMLNHSGLYCKMIRDSKQELYLLLPTHDEILNTLYEKDKYHYYYHDFYQRPSNNLENEEISTPAVNFEPPNIRMKRLNSFARILPNFPDNINTNTQKIFRFYTNAGLTLRHVNANINSNRIEYYNSIPPTNLEVYFEASCFIYTPNSESNILLQELAALLDKLDTYEDQINLLLDFTSSSHSFSYSKDTKALFAEQTLVAPQSDCEDRAVLFAALAQQLLKIKVLGIEYTHPSDHVVVAIPHQSNLPLNNLSFIEYEGKPYVLCDPTAYDAAYGKIDKRREYQSYEVIHFSARCLD